MKKLFFSLVMATMALMGSVAYAQTEMQSATLQQGDKTMIYYGANAFVDAFNAVKDKTDVITLSAGSFRSTTINKSVRIYGAGYEENADKGVYPTIIGDIRIIHGTDKNEDNEPVNKIGDLDDLYIEGICTNNLYLGISDNNSAIISGLIIKKSKFNSHLGFDVVSGAVSTTTNCQVIDCVINEFFTDSGAYNFTILNCIINKIRGYAGWVNEGLLIKNSILFESFYLCATLKDNIIYYLDQSENMTSSYFANNILRTTDANILNKVTQNYNNKIVKTDEAIFGAEIGQAYNPQLTYAIKADAAKTYIGTDGTPIGLYGGYYPFTKTPSTPQIVSKAIDVQSTVDGKLKVSIKVEAQTEAPAKAPTQQ